ncbi:MAG: CehA/McbA family metallohydrolase [Spirochaetota bacterium]
MSGHGVVVARQEITEQRHVIRLNVPETTEVHLDLRFSSAILAFVRVHDPASKLVAMAACMNGRDRIAIRIHPDAATLNALPCAPLPGEYVVTVTVPLVEHQRAGATVEVSASPEPLSPTAERELTRQPLFDADGHVIGRTTVRNSEHRYYRGDLHGHTQASDGMLDGEQAVRLLEERRLDYMAITEHNLITFGHRAGTVVIVPAFELTLPEGHLNVYGVDRVEAIDELWSRFHRNEATIQKLVRGLRERGYLVSINHMFLRPWAFVAKGLPVAAVDTIELMCDPTYKDSPDANEKAVDFIDYLWSRGNRVYGVGGSDSHKLPDEPYDGSVLPSIYGDPSTWVFCEGLSIENLLSGIRRGHSYVARFVTLDISIDEGRRLPGDRVAPDASTFDYRVRIADFGEPSTSAVTSDLTGEIVLDGTVVARVPLSPEQPDFGVRDVMSLVHDRESWWLRASVRDGAGSIVAYVNPIYCGNDESGEETVDELIAAFEETRDQSRAP